MSNWRDCIVILMDLAGIKGRAIKGDSQASTLMRRFHEVVRKEMGAGLPSLDHAYVWNDAVVLLAYLDAHSHALEESFSDATRLKRKVDCIGRSYAIAVKGQAFPPGFATTSSESGYHSYHDARVTVIKASSYAMANCFGIEAEAKRKKLRKAWYIDERIVKELGMTTEESIQVKLLPSGNRRKVYLYTEGFCTGV